MKFNCKSTQVETGEIFWIETGVDRGREVDHVINGLAEERIIVKPPPPPLSSAAASIGHHRFAIHRDGSMEEFPSTLSNGMGNVPFVDFPAGCWLWGFTQPL